MEKFFNIGMTKQAVLSKLDKTKATTQTKQLIQNFWQTDKDGKVTNEIELAMLNSWANGSEKVKMPTRGEKLEVSAHGHSESRPNDPNLTTKIYTSGSGEKDSLVIERNEKDGKYYDSVSWYKNDATRQDFLHDMNLDGYADRRVYFEAKSRGEGMGLYDEKIVFDIEL